ncbi:hypothetical protein FSARC_14586 [Fusarium sarcochroum]|uniref:Uncharacterized protein n=1 Tax=Fusarium sarcochroum TaxID=1208366 RepID=A0A8H4SS79_9HYPO|nr:hypothetical protein FSARC_14586 [Fusarium sarcochroum]
MLNSSVFRAAGIINFWDIVVEHKKHDKSEQLKRKAYRQAVSASACAVRLNQIAAKYAVQQIKDAHVPPTPAVTTIGPVVKVWITYFGRGFMAYYDDESWQRCNREHSGYCTSILLCRKEYELGRSLLLSIHNVQWVVLNGSEARAGY